MLGSERTLQLLTEPLAAVSAQVASGGAFDWPTAEAALYCVRAVHRYFPTTTQSDLVHRTVTRHANANALFR